MSGNDEPCVGGAAEVPLVVILAPVITGILKLKLKLKLELILKIDL